MIAVRCPICERVMAGEDLRQWPQFPFCGPRCRLIDLGRWLGEDYRLPAESEGNVPADSEDCEIP